MLICLVFVELMAEIIYHHRPTWTAVERRGFFKKWRNIVGHVIITQRRWSTYRFISTDFSTLKNRFLFLNFNWIVLVQLYHNLIDNVFLLSIPILLSHWNLVFSTFYYRVFLCYFLFFFNFFCSSVLRFLILHLDFLVHRLNWRWSILVQIHLLQMIFIFLLTLSPLTISIELKNLIYSLLQNLRLLLSCIDLRVKLNIH